MGDIHKTPPPAADSKNVLPDVVHSQQIPQGTAVTDTEASQIDTPQNVTTPAINEDDSHTESISEHIPSKMEYSVTESDNAGGTTQPGLLQVEQDTDPSRNSSLNIPVPPSPSDNPSAFDPSKSTSWPIDPKSTDICHISEESPVNLASESVSKETHETLQAELEESQHDKSQESPRSDQYLNSLNDETYPKSNQSEEEKEIEKHSHSTGSSPLSLSTGAASLQQGSSGSEEIIKLDIRGHGAPKFPLSAAKIFFGPPPEGSTLIDENIQPLPVFQTLMSPFLVSAGEMKVEELFPEKIESKVDPVAVMEKNSLSSDNKIEQSDLLVEEMTVDYDTKEKTQDESLPSLPQPKSLAPEDTMSFSTMTTDYKTICEEFQAKLVHLEAAITQRDQLIEELTVKFQRTSRERDTLALENQHLTHEVTEASEHDTIKQQLSDYAKYESMLKDDTKFYSALSSGSASSNGEKDNDREEITVNYSKSDLKSSDSDDFQGYELKLTEIISRFDASIEENMRNKLRESLIQVLCDEIAKIRIEADTDVKELETQLQQDKHAFTVETRRLRELLATVKAGNADIDELREELDRKHEKEMENLRTYFEKKCSDMERSYSEEVYRGRACASPLSASPLEAPPEAGDCFRRRTRSAELPSLTAEVTSDMWLALQYSEEEYRGLACASPLEAPPEAGDCFRRRTRSAELPSLTAEVTSDMWLALQYSEEEYRGLACASPLEAPPEAGDCFRRRTRSAELPSLTAEVTSDMWLALQYSEEEYRGLACASPLEAPPEAGDCFRRRTRSAELPSLTAEVTSDMWLALQYSEEEYRGLACASPLEAPPEAGDCFRRRTRSAELPSLTAEVTSDMWLALQYSEEEYRGLACASPLEAPPEAGDCFRRRTRSAELPSLTAEMPPLEFAVKQANRRTDMQQFEELKAEHAAIVQETRHQHRLAVAALQAQIDQLKARVQSAENTESNVSLYQQDIDLELEKDAIFAMRLEEAKQEVIQHMQEQIQVLLSDPDAELSSWPLELVALRDKIHDARPDKEVSSLREEVPGEADKWKQRRHTTFDQNRHLEEVTKERDSFKRVATSLQRIVGQLVAYCAAAEDELNRTVLAELLARLLPDTSLIEDSRPSTPNLDLSVARSKHVHFAPDLSVLADLDSDGVAGFLQGQRDVSIEIKRELELSLLRLREEAQELLETAARVKGKTVSESHMLESSQVQITELVEKLDARHSGCDNCELHRKNMEEAMTECLQRENLLRSDLEAALMKIAQLMQSEREMNSCDVVEGYGTGQQHQTPTSLPVVRPGRRAPPAGPAAWAGPGRRAPPAGPAAWAALGGCSSPRASYDALHKERDDLQQQLEAANRQLRSTRSFVEEQGAEREAERDEFARRVHALRDENCRLTARLQTNATILNEVEQLEAQTRDMNTLIQDLESRKASADEELKATNDKISLLRDIIANLESQLEQKAAHESVILEQLEGMRQTIDDRDSKMRGLLGELESLRSEKVELSEASMVEADDRAEELMEKIKEQSRWLEEKLHRRTRRLERVHETCSAPCSEPSEDVSLRDRRPKDEAPSPGDVTPRWPGMPELLGVWEAVEALSRAEDAALKRIADLDMQRVQLKDVAQEVRAERDVLQARMSEQALKISSLAARLETQRNNAEALAHQAAGQLTVSLHDALAEVQRLKEELESKDKQLLRAKQNLEEKEKLNEQHQVLYGNSCNPKDKVLILERELSAAQCRIAQLEALAKSLEQDKDELQASLRDQRRALAEREEQLQEIMALKLEDDQKEDEPEGKTSARTLSDIVSISEFDEQDLQMRRAELKAQNLSLSGVPYADNRNRTHLNRTLPPDLSKPNMSSLNLDFIDHFDLPSFTPRAESLPGHLTSTQNKDPHRMFKRNTNETTVFGTAEKFGDSVKHSTAQNIPDNCSMYPNREVDESKDLSVAPKKIDFSLEPSHDNRSQDDEFTSLRELGITLDIRQENFPDILTQLKHEIKKSRSELDTCKSELKNAEEQLCEFPALKEEVEELKGLLENTMATMENDKKFYENQLEHFSSNKNLLEQRVNELTQEVNEKSKDLHLLKEDILRRENMILELAKEKRNLTNKMTELEIKIDEIQSRNTSLEKCETDNRILKEKVTELQKLEQLVSEKNQQIDSLNQHLDRLDDLQRCLNDKTEECDNLKEAFEEKSNELFKLQATIDAQNRDIDKINEENNNLNINNKELKLKLTKLEKEQENASLKLQNSESELERVNSLNNELTSKIDELKDLTDKLKDKETEIDILNEDINSYHEEIATLKEQLKMVSRSPSPKSKTEKTDRQASNDKKQLAKIRKQISLLQHELDFNRKELNDKAFELAKAKLDVTELRNSLSQASKLAADRGLQAAAAFRDLQAVQNDRDRLTEHLEELSERLREESNISELRIKLQEKTEKCQELEAEIQDMKDLVDRLRDSARQSPSEQRALVVSGTRSPTAELERALRDQLDYSHRLDQDIMEQILSASSDEHEDIPRLALNSSKSSSSIHSTSSDRVRRLQTENDKLLMQVGNLEARLKDKDALITELNRIRDKLVQDWQAAKLRLQAEKDNCGRLQLLLLTHKESAETLQNQDSNMIQILKKRLESAMQSELELQQKETQHKARIAALERQLVPGSRPAGHEPGAKLLQAELENSERLRGEISLLKSKLEVERTRLGDTQAMLDHSKTHFQKELDAKSDQCHALRTELAELRRLKHDAGVELLRAKELLNIQSGAISELEQKLATASLKQRPFNDALTEIESHKTELAREITNLRSLVASPELSALRDARQDLAHQVETLQGELRTRNQGQEEKDQAIRYLHNRCLKLESCRKALVWQKRYLQRVLAGYGELERTLRLSRAPEPISGKRRFKCVATCVVVVLRMGFLVRRRRQLRALSASAILRPRSEHTPTTRQPQPTESTPVSRPRARARAAPHLGDFIRRSYSSNSQHEDSFGLSSPRGEASEYLNKLGLVSRCLNQAMDASRDVP